MVHTTSHNIISFLFLSFVASFLSLFVNACLCRYACSMIIDLLFTLTPCKVQPGWFLLNLEIQGLHLDNAPVDQLARLLQPFSQGVISHKCGHLLQFLPCSVNCHDHFDDQAVVNDWVVLDDLGESFLIRPVVHHLVEFVVQPLLYRVALRFVAYAFVFFDNQQVLGLCFQEFSRFLERWRVDLCAVWSLARCTFSGIED